MTPGRARESLALGAAIAAFTGCGSRNIDGAYGREGSARGGVGADAGVVIEHDGGACLAVPYVGEVAPVDLLFMVDKSASMECPVGAAGMTCTSPPNPPPAVTRWTSMRDALVQFAMSPESAGIGAGISFFPILTACFGPWRSRVSKDPDRPFRSIAISRFDPSRSPVSVIPITFPQGNCGPTVTWSRTDAG